MGLRAVGARRADCGVQEAVGTAEWRTKAICLLVFLVVVPSQAQNSINDTNALLAFKAAVDPNNTLTDWGGSSSYCSWSGINCNNNRVFKLRLPAHGLVGTIPSGTLGRLDQLRAISLHSNKLTGPLPDDLAALPFVQHFYLNDNQFTGLLPSNFSVWPRLLVISFADNKLSGTIPDSITQLQLVTQIFLEDNDFSGSIPDVTVASLTDFNVATNNLSGPIPVALQKFPASSFAGNQAVCGPPTNTTCAPSPSPSPVPVPVPSLAPSPAGTGKHKKSKLATGVIIAIVVGGVALLLLLLLLLICFLCFCKKKGRRTAKPTKGEAGVGKSEESKDEYSSSIQEPERSKLIFFEGKQYTFDLEDLLRASAEVLGKGSVGTAYKAVLEDGSVVTVKRLKDVTTARKDFETQIQAVGRLHHRNLVPLRAYYFSKDEKLLVYDYMAAGSLSALLHGTKGGSRTALDWISRVRIATGAARGLAFLHSEHNFTHGNIKSSNVLLTRELEGCLSDFGLVQLLSSTAAASRIIGYRAPEVLETRKVSPKGDVYSFGVLLLELLTGKAPTQATLTDEGIDLPRWVQSVVREEWTSEVFDEELMRYLNIEEEMVQMLQIAMQCVAQVPSQRPTMDQVVKSLDDIRQFSDSGNENGDDTSRSAYDTSAEKSKEDLDVPAELYSSETLTRSQAIDPEQQKPPA